ncbi:MAG: sensor histidine kinase [Mycobacteriales bacterium]
MTDPTRLSRRAGLGDDAWRVVAVLLAMSVVVMASAAAALSPRTGVVVDPAPFALIALFILTLAGLTVAWARPRNLIGWLLMGAAALQSMSLIGAAYAQAGYAEPGVPWPGAYLAASLGAWTWFPSLTLPVAVLPSIYPSGRPPSRGWRRVAWAGILGIVGESIALSGAVDDIVPGLQPVWHPPAWLAIVTVVLGFVLLAVAVVGGLIATVVRTVRARAPERQQLALLLTALLPAPVLFFLPVSQGIGQLGYAFLGVVVALAVLRYQLLGISVVMRRTLLYVPLTALVALVVAGVSTLIARVAPDGPVPILAAAAVVAVLVGPVTRALRRGVDRFVLGDRADPLAAVDRVTSRAEHADDDPVGSLLAALARTVQARYVAVVDAAGRTLAEVGDRQPDVERLTLRQAGHLHGELVISPVREAAGRRIVTGLLPHIAAVVRSVRLTADLHMERDRALTATTAERDRIRRDLHDGLGPALSGISLGLQAADRALANDIDATHAILRRTRREADIAVAEVHRVLAALRPSALDRETLDGAVRSTAHQLGLGNGASAFACTSDDLTGLPPVVEEVAFRIAAEALNNVVRHADAAHCDVSLRRVDGHLEVDVADDGRGMLETPVAGVGLESMRRRAEDAGGTLIVTSPTSAASGTLVRARLPLNGDW